MFEKQGSQTAIVLNIHLQIVFSFREKSHKEIVCPVLYYFVCIQAYSSIYLIKHTCSSNEKKEGKKAGIIERKTKHIKIVATVRKIHASSLEIIRELQ